MALIADKTLAVSFVEGERKKSEHMFTVRLKMLFL